jgi:hypothetical protein
MRKIPLSLNTGNIILLIKFLSQNFTMTDNAQYVILGTVYVITN